MTGWRRITARRIRQTNRCLIEYQKSAKSGSPIPWAISPSTVCGFWSGKNAETAARLLRPQTSRCPCNATAAASSTARRCLGVTSDLCATSGVLFNPARLRMR